MGLADVDSRRNSNVSQKKFPPSDGHVLPLSVSTESVYFRCSGHPDISDTLLESGRS
jgi:hypothetical protein